MRTVMNPALVVLLARALAIAALVTALLAPTSRAEDPAPAGAGGKVYTVATSHLDTQWRWTIQTTISEYLRATLDDNFALLGKYPDYVFSFEGAFRYQLFKEYYPEDFARVRDYVAQGRWRICGSWLDAVDVNMPSPESLFRHALYGNGWFDREFGKRSVDVFLPDCFGFGYALPSIMAHSGLTGFSTQKLTWGSAYGTPFDIGRWRGVDGSEVIAAVKPGDYVGELKGDLTRDPELQASVDRTVAAGGPAVAFKYYGTGDTGGAPTEASVQALQSSVGGDGPLTIYPAGADQIFRDLTPAQVAGLPVYDGELVMTSHGAGCYTSQATMKRCYRRCEVLADASERAAVMAWWLGGKDYPQAELERAWTRFLWHGFHDDLTGTSIPEAYQFSWNDLLLSQQEFGQVLESSVGAVARGLDTEVPGQALVVYNPLSFAQTAPVVLPALSGGATRAIGPDGQDVPLQPGDPRTGTPAVFLATVPACGFAVYGLESGGSAAPAPAVATWDADAGTLDTERYRLTFAPEGMTSLVDKLTGKELLAAPPRLQLLHDEPARWSAWEVDYDDLMAAPYAEVPLGGVPESVVTGPAQARLTFRHGAAGSVFRQTLTVSGDRLDWELDIEWATKGTLLKAAFFTTARDTQATYDLGLGAIARGLNRPRLYEVPAQRWADVTDASGAFGLTIMNDGRHGWDRPDAGTLRLSLIHTPAISPDWAWVADQATQDLGRHRVTIGMMGHGSDWRAAAVHEADALNQPLLPFTADRHPGPWGRSISMLSVGGGGDATADHPQVAVRAFKRAESGDWVVVRLQEITGTPARKVVVAPMAAVREFRELRADEVEIPADADVFASAGALVCSLKPYQPRTFALRLEPLARGRGLAPLRSVPLDLPWNLDAMGTPDAPADGDFDGTGCTLPGALIPAEFTRDGTLFRTGPRGDGQANLVRCQGQTLELPEGGQSNLPVLQVLMCSIGGSREAIFALKDSKEHRVWVPDGRDFFGQWDSRLLEGDLAQEAVDLIPAFTAEADLGWVVTHRNDPAGLPEPYVFTHFYRVEVPVRNGARTVVLPDDPSLLILAASLTESPGARRAGAPFAERPTGPSLRFEAPRRTFLDSVTVRITSPNRGASIRVGDSTHEPQSYDGAPITLTETTRLDAVVTADAYPESTARSAQFTRLIPWPAPDSDLAGQPGLAGKVYAGAWNALPDWSQLTPERTLVNPVVAIPAGLAEEDIGVILEGRITVPARGIYTFWLSSDDGSRLFIDDNLLVDHDGLHGSTPVEGEAPLAPGQHRIRVEFFQHLGGRDLRLEWSGPGIERQDVPAAALSR